MISPNQISWIAVDWGTTHLRAYAMSADNKLIEEAFSTKGMGKLNMNQFEPALLELITKWLPLDNCLPVIACGMVGAKQGWKEAKYQAVPCPALVAKNAIHVETNESKIKVWILPGLSQIQPADVMRGEETQLAGLFALGGLNKAQICMPGTHSKWVAVNEDEVVSFSTFMTGEVFSLLCEHSILRHDVNSTAWNDQAYIEGVKSGLNNASKVFNLAFALRAENLLDALAPERTRSKLSGLLIGAELVGAKAYWESSRRVELIGEPFLTQLYSQALNIVGIQPCVHKAREVSLAGMSSAYQNLLSLKLI